MTQRPPSRRTPSNAPPREAGKSPQARKERRAQPHRNVNRRELLSLGAGATVAGAAGIIAWKTGIGSALGGRKSAAATPTPTPVQVMSDVVVPSPAPRIVIDPTQPPHPTPTLVPGSSASDMVVETSISEIRTGYDKGWYTVAEYTQAALDRIGAMDQRGPYLNAVIELNPDAMDIAEQLDREAREGRIRGPLHGMPVLVKDVFATGDSMRTTAGSLALERNEVIRDAFMIEALRDAGAIILGKTNLTEFSNFRGGTPSGWSSRGGQTVNPYVLSYSAWGSSTGSAVATAASYVPFAIGSETDGSIICPAAACGVVGLKPTVGLVSRRGSLGISFIQDSPGPMGRTVEDVAYALGAMVGYDAEDMAYGEFAKYAPAAGFKTFPVPETGEQDYTRVLDPDGLNGARIGVCRSMFGLDPEVDAHVEIALDAMREAGAEIIDEIYMDAAGIVADAIDEGNMLTVEFAWGFQDFLDTYTPGGPITSLADVIDFNYEHADETLIYGDQQGLEFALNTGTIYDPWFQELVEKNITTTRDNGIDLTMDEYKLDALVAPTTILPSTLYEDAFRGSSSQVPSMAGYPSLTLPIGYTNGLPAGIHFFGRAFSEKTLLKLAYGLEQTLQAREVPQYLDEPIWDPGQEPATVEMEDPASEGPAWEDEEGQ